MAKKKPVIAVPIGDPAGVGPEIVAKACALDKVTDAADVIVIGDLKVMERAIRIVGTDLTINVVEKPEEGDYRRGILNLIDLNNIDQSEFSFGTVQAMCGKAAFAYIKKSIELAMNDEADAVATTPINKESLHAAQVPYIGHTEIFGALTGTPDPLTMFETNGLRVFFLTRHKSLRDMLDDITKDNIKACVKESLAALRRLGVTEGTMAVAGLNPHCGEHGLFGWEEVNEIAPAVIATKTLDFDRTISITNGMPILRTSVDHGTAFDIAGKGIVSEISMAEAILLAAKYAPFFAKK